MDLDALASLLATSFQKKSAAKLSERNVVELVNKLKKLGLVNDVLVHTTNGKEYITKTRIAMEIKQQMQAAGGRVGMVDLPQLLGVDLAYCEQAAASIIGESADVQLIEGELITPQYFDGVALEVAEELAAAGSLALADLARRLSLSVDILTSALQSRLGRLWHGRMEGGLLYTDAYVLRLTCQMRGALRGTSTPCGVTDLVDVAFTNANEAGAASKLSSTIIAELLEAGAASGTLRQGANQWTPAIYQTQQKEGIAAFLSSNGFVTFDMVRKAGVSQPKPWLESAHPSAVLLDTVLVAQSLIQQANAALEEAVADAGWADVASLIPDELSADAPQLLPLCSCVAAIEKEGGAVFAGSCLVSAAFRTALAGLVASAATEAAQTLRSAAPAPSAAAPPSSSGKGGAAFDDDDDDGPPTKGSNKKGKKGGKGGGGGGGGGGAAAGKQGGGKGAGKGGAGAGAGPDAAEQGLSAKQIEDLLSKAYPELPDAAGGDLVPALASSLQPAAQAALEAARRALFAEGQEGRKKRREALGKRLQDGWGHLQLMGAGAGLFAGDEGNLGQHVRHVLRTEAADAVDAALLLAVPEDGDADTEAAEAAAEAGPLSAAQRKALTAKLPSAAAKQAAAAATEAVAQGKGTVADLEEAVLALAAEAGVRLKRLDRKGEKAALAAHRAALAAQLESASSPADALLVAVPLAVADAAGLAVALPGKLLGPAIERLAGGAGEGGGEQGAAGAAAGALPEGRAAFLKEYCAACVEALQQGPQSERAGWLAENLAALKDGGAAAAGGGGAAAAEEAAGGGGAPEA